MYHFFSKWKELQDEVFSIKQELVDIERYYKVRIALWERIWRSLSTPVMDFRSAKKLLAVYEAQKYIKRYLVVMQKLGTISSIGFLDKKEVDHFHELIVELKNKVIAERELAQNVLRSIVSGERPENPRFYVVQDILKIESEFLKVQDKTFKKIEEAFLIKKEPGSRSGTYQQIIEGVTQGRIGFKDNKLWIEGKPIQGLKVVHNKIILKGDHYSTMQNARWVQGDLYVKPSAQDPYSYFVERGKIQSLNQRSIQKLLGIKNAEAMVSLEIEIFPEQLYVRVDPGLPIKFAIANLEPHQVRKVVQKATAVAA
ncbi:hypothetical protein HY772_06060 [Candidatus Woesearchaeota archaeon]|nr:hypothetical protein [Candidatus Woesearchaeota archaeon]